MASIFVNTYQLYKKQTNQLAQWLLDTAVHNGHSLEDKTPGSSYHGEPRSVNHKSTISATSQEKRARAAANGPEDNKSTQNIHSSRLEGSSHAIRLSQFIELATAIAKSARNNFKIPKAIPELIVQIIKMRGSVSAYYKMQSRSRPDDHKLRGDNSKHRYFISKLEDVLEILNAVAEPSTDGVTQPQDALKNSRKQAQDISAEDLSNRFSALEVEEPTGLELHANSLSLSEKAEKPRPRYDHAVVYDASEYEDEEIDFAVFCLFEDLRRIRIFLDQVWQDYNLGKLDLMTASIVTNTAFGFAQTIDAEFCSSYSHLLSPQFHNNPVMSMYLMNCMRSGADVNYRQHPNDVYNYEMREIGAFLYVPVYILLEAFSRVLKPGYIPLAKNGYFGIYNPNSDRRKMSYRQKST